MKMQKKQFRIGALARELNLEKFVIRFWEKEFGIRSSRSEGGQRYYSLSDVTKFKQIKSLLYDKKFTIAGAKDALSGDTDVPKIIGSQKTTLDTAEIIALNKTDLIRLRTVLISLKNLLEPELNI